MYVICRLQDCYSSSFNIPVTHTHTHTHKLINFFIHAACHVSPNNGIIPRGIIAHIYHTGERHGNIPRPLLIARVFLGFWGQLREGAIVRVVANGVDDAVEDLSTVGVDVMSCSLNHLCMEEGGQWGKAGNELGCSQGFGYHKEE